jgi:hypothetical protein
MTFFHDFSVPLWQIFYGNLLMVVTSVFYIAWWIVCFRPNASGRFYIAGTLIGIALLAGVGAIVVTSLGINSLSSSGKGIPVLYILMGATVFYIVLLAVTRLAFHRPVTSELLLMTVWAALELSVIAVLQGSGRFGKWQVLTLIALIILATGVGLISYIVHYRLDESARFWNGLVPLIADTGVVAVILAMLARS